jgi:hypothetical protein
MLVTVSIPNPLPVPASVERLKGFTAKLKERFGEGAEATEEQWLGNVLRFDFTGPRKNRFVGTVMAGENTVEVTVESAVFDGWAGGIARRIARENIKAALAEALGS